MSDINAQKEATEELPPKPSELEHTQTITQDAVFGEITEEGPNYRNVRRRPFQPRFRRLMIPRLDGWARLL